MNGVKTSKATRQCYGVGTMGVGVGGVAELCELVL